jgi:tRNA threonylcarbamoyladenosine biosynthesis protein TsaE
MKILIKDKKHLPKAAGQFLDYTMGKKIFAFYGSMGAGKTTIIKAICEALGAVDIITSPTFTLINEYKTAGDEYLYHFDFYRIKKTEEVFDFGFEEYLASGAYCFLEWPEKVCDILPPETVNVRITVDNNEQRLVTIE